MIKACSILRASISDIKAVDRHPAVGSLIDRIVQKISKMEFPSAEHFESYLRHMWRMNHKPQTLMGNFQAVRGFLGFYCSIGKSQLQEIVSADLEAFVEHEQDRGLKVTSVRKRLNYIWAFVRSLIERDIVEESILRRKIKLRVPNFLPRALAPGGVRKILACIKETRDRALVLVLLRTGMRIGNFLA